MIAAGDQKGYVFNAEGINPYKLGEHKNRAGSVVSYKHAKPISCDEFFALDCDILVPAARELRIGEKDEVARRLESAMKRTYARVCDFSHERKVDLRTAAYAIGLLRIQTAYAECGIWP